MTIKNNSIQKEKARKRIDTANLVIMEVIPLGLFGGVHFRICKNGWGLRPVESALGYCEGSWERI